MKIKIDDHNWKAVLLLDPPSRTVTIEDGSVWHISKTRNEILELDIFMSRIIEQHASWEIEDRKTLALTRGRQSFQNTGQKLKKGMKKNLNFFIFINSFMIKRNTSGFRNT